MKCPHCEYEHGWSGELLKNVVDDRGDFFAFVTTMWRRTSIGESETCKAYACPCCTKMFIDWSD